MVAEALTQAEIDALLSGGPLPESAPQAAEPSGAAPGPSLITADEEDAVRNYAEIIASAGSNVLSTILGDDVSISVEDVVETDPRTIGGQIKEKVVSFTTNYSGLISGQTLVNLGFEESLKLAGQMTGGGEIQELADVEESALNEAVQQVISAANTDLAAQLGGEVGIDPPDVVVTPDNLADLLPPSDQREILVTYQIASAGLSGRLTQVLPRNLVQGMMDAAAGAGTRGAVSDHRAYASSRTAPEILTQPAAFQPLVAEGRGPSADITNLELILDIPLEVKVELGRTTRKIREVLELGPGSVVELDKLAGEPVDILVNEKLFAKGEVVVIDENFGVRITDIMTIEERIEALK
ncbi:MAG TPA: flagellar motor switch protein FliN [bacterium]|nr:flagellar motor switch protein FliN [bacterium]HPO08948.1 flagellar motor switch protein FliN [bacterium]HQP99569.1 flagellar motor switch protein FliN [bacterium]